MNSQDYRNLQEAYLNVYQEIDEAEGSYGQTPKATAAYIALATRRGGKKSTKSKALQHAIRSSARQSINTPSHRSNMTPSDRTYHRGQDENRGGDREGIDFDEFDNFDEFDTGPSGPGGMPTGKKLKRQRIRGISASYEPDLFDVILEYLITEGYADTEDSALVIMANMSEDWRESICENVSSGKGRVRNIQSKPTGLISNTELNKSSEERKSAENIRIKEAGDEAHAKATSKGMSFSDAQTRRRAAENLATKKIARSNR